ncbi:MAG TPA: ATP-binding protein [Kofleriaceae bacterium]|nr:ATP-binding protein [Kofleriaceae bacterium]
MSALEAIDFASLFAAAPALLLVLGVDERFTICGASDAYLVALAAPRDAVVGRPLFDVVGDVPALRASIDRVMTSKRSDMTALHADDHWTAVNAPVLDDRGAVRWIIHRRDVIDERMREFMSTLLRELRTPLAPLRYGLNVLRAATPPDHATARVRAVMERQVDCLVRMVDDVLDVSRLDCGSFELRREPVHLGDLVAAAVEASEPRRRGTGHEILLDLPEQPVWIDADAGCLTRVISHLLDNAARFTDRGGRIVARAIVEGDHAVVVVRDTGRGFAPTVGDALFDMFRKSDRSTGLGIGLALARKLTEMHGGAISAHSEGEGRGAEFRIRLPLAAVQDAPRTVARGTPTSLPALTSPRVLIADDNRDAADTLADILRHLGCEVAVAYDGGEAVELARSFAPELAFLDIGMPVLDGYATARQIRTDVGERPIKLVALTGWGQADDRQRAREAGFDEHLVKPATFEAVRALLPSATR